MAQTRAECGFLGAGHKGRQLQDALCAQVLERQAVVEHIYAKPLDIDTVYEVGVVVDHDGPLTVYHHRIVVVDGVGEHGSHVVGVHRVTAHHLSPTTQ